MKKALLSIILPTLLLVGCGKAPAASSQYVSTVENGIPTIYAAKASEATHTTYLMMSRYGYLDIDGAVTTGVSVPEKYYENCIVWKTTPNGLLPGLDQVKSYKSGATFRGWAQYNGNVYPDYLSEVPEASGQCVYAIFDGTDPSGGGSGGGGGGGGLDPFDVTINVDLTIFAGWEGISNFSVYVWGANGQEPLGDWHSCAGNLTGAGNTRSVSISNLTYAVVGAVFYFDQAGGDNPGRKQTTDMTVNISSEGDYNIAPVGSEITWDAAGKMTNFTISKQ